MHHFGRRREIDPGCRGQWIVCQCGVLVEKCHLVEEIVRCSSVIFLRGYVCAAPCDISWEVVCYGCIVEAAAGQEAAISHEGYISLTVIKSCGDINMMPAGDACVALAHGEHDGA